MAARGEVIEKGHNKDDALYGKNAFAKVSFSHFVLSHCTWQKNQKLWGHNMWGLSNKDSTNINAFFGTEKGWEPENFKWKKQSAKGISLEFKKSLNQ